MPNGRTYISSCSFMPLFLSSNPPPSSAAGVYALLSITRYSLTPDPPSAGAQFLLSCASMLLMTCFTGSWLSWSELLAKWTYHSHTLIFLQAYILDIFADSFYFCFPLILYLLWDRGKALSPIFISDVKAMVSVLIGVWGCCQEDQGCLGVLSSFLYTSPSHYFQDSCLIASL